VRMALDRTKVTECRGDRIARATGYDQRGTRMKALTRDNLTQITGSQAKLQVFSDLRETIVTCERCKRLRDYCRGLGETKRKAFRDQEYWSKPVPGFGDVKARILVLGLAPGAHGANRTGRPFTGDGSGDFMYPVLHELGLASKPKAVGRDDGLKLRHLWIGSVVRCAPPGDKPKPEEIRNCSSHLTAEVVALSRVKVVVCLGKIAWDGYLAHLVGTGVIERRSAYTFRHAAEYKLPSVLAKHKYRAAEQGDVWAGICEGAGVGGDWLARWRPTRRALSESHRVD